MNNSETIWAVVVGYNHCDDTLACLTSLVEHQFPASRIVFVDNCSTDDSSTRVHDAFPEVSVLQMDENVGFARGYNAGMAYALQQGADYVFILNNDTVVAKGTVKHLVESARKHPDAGMLVPKIYYYDHPDRVWSAGARCRRFPPVVVLQRTREADDGRYDGTFELEFVTTCALLFPRGFLETTGLLDANYFILHDDYDLSIRARRAGYAIRLVPESHLWHKVSASTRAGTRNPFIWHHTGRSEAIFRRRHRDTHPWLTGWVHVAYVVLRMLGEGHSYGLKPFLAGYREGMRIPLSPVPKWNDTQYIDLQ